MKVAFFIPSLKNKGGVERATISLLNSIVENFYNETTIYLITFDSHSFAFALDERIKVISLEVTNWKLQFWRLIKNTIKALKVYNIDILVSVETMSLLFSFLPVKLMRKRPKLVVWEHFNFKNNNGRWIRGKLRYLAAKKTDLVITLTERDAITWKKELTTKAKITFIYNVNPFDRNESLYDKNSKIAIAIGRYVEVKGFDRLIKAWSLFEETYGTDWHLKIIGYGEKYNELKSLIENNKTSTISLVDGSTADVKSFYRTAGLYCMTSYFEGLPMTLIESQLFALPSIAYDIYSGPSEILKYGSGVLVNDNNIEEFAEALFRVTSDDKLRIEMSKAASKNSHAFVGVNIAQKWIDKFKEIL